MLPNATTQPKTVGWYRPLGYWDVWWRKLLLVGIWGLILVLCLWRQYAVFDQNSLKAQFLMERHFVTRQWYSFHQRLKIAEEMGASGKWNQDQIVALINDGYEHLQDLDEFIKEFDEAKRYPPFQQKLYGLMKSLEQKRQTIRYHTGWTPEVAADIRAITAEEDRLLVGFLEQGAGSDLIENMIRRYYPNQRSQLHTSPKSEKP